MESVQIPPAIAVCSLTKNYRKKKVLKNIDFQVASGECVVVVGHNGCGKSTLLRILAGVQPADHGSIRYFGTPAGKNSRVYRKYCGYVPQENPLLEELSVGDNLKFWSGNDRGKFEQMIQQFDLEEILRTRVEKLSGGMKRRLAIACALLEFPPILLMDEPTSALDIYYKEKILAWMLEYKKCNGTILMASHEKEEILFADRCLLMDDGCVRELSRDKEKRWKELKKHLLFLRGGEVYGNKI